MNLFLNLLDFDHLRSQLEILFANFNHEFLVCFKLSFVLELVSIFQTFEVVKDRFGVFLEGFRDSFLVQSTLNYILDLRLFESVRGNHIGFRCFTMVGKIKAGSVSMAGHFDPTIGCFYLSVPTVSSIMCHFSRHVLSKSDVVFVETHGFQEEERPAHEISKCLVVNHFPLDSLTESNIFNNHLFCALLVFSR